MTAKTGVDKRNPPFDQSDKYSLSFIKTFGLPLISRPAPRLWTYAQIFRFCVVLLSHQ